MKKKIVISAINIHYGGTLSIVKGALSWLSNNITDEYDVIALVHNKALYSFSNITYIEFPDSRSSWFKRLQYEYRHFKVLSREIKPYLWFSLHDISPVVQAEVKAVYCHNPGPYYKVSLHEAMQDKVFAAFTLFYKYLYRLNIHSNSYVIVQQDWIREFFKKHFGLPHKKVVVAYPETANATTAQPGKTAEYGPKLFFYPSFPRVFKNFEIIGEAVNILKSRNVTEFKVVLTMDGTENPYAANILSKYEAIPEIQFVGALSREEVESYYALSDCLIFPSKLETWGLPITEYKPQQKPILLANLPYAKETVGSYSDVAFFDPEAPVELADLMQGVITENITFEKTEGLSVAAPFTQNWGELFNLLLNKQ